MREGWMWSGSAPGVEAEGLRDLEPQAAEDAVAWLRAHPGGKARLMPAWLEDGSRTLSAWWTCGEPRVPRQRRDGRIIWARLPQRDTAGAGMEWRCPACGAAGLIAAL